MKYSPWTSPGLPVPNFEEIELIESRGVVSLCFGMIRFFALGDIFQESICYFFLFGVDVAFWDRIQS